MDYAAELDALASPHQKLEFKEFQVITNQFHKWANKQEDRILTTKELFELISDCQTYQEEYKKVLSENDTRECLRIFLSTDPSLVSDKKIIKLAKTWRLI